MNATLEQVQPDVITEAFVTPMEEHADRFEGERYGIQLQYVAKSTKRTVQELAKWMGEEGYVFARKVTANR